MACDNNYDIFGSIFMNILFLGILFVHNRIQSTEYNFPCATRPLSVIKKCYEITNYVGVVWA